MKKTLALENLQFERGDASFKAEDFLQAIRPYFGSLDRIGRTNYLFVATVPGGKPHVTGYHGNETIDATINSRVLDSEKAGGTWAVYKLN